MKGGKETAKDFFEEVTRGYKNEEIYKGGKAKVRTMEDGTKITYREVSHSDGTPVVDINSGCTFKKQKIHFVN